MDGRPDGQQRTDGRSVTDRRMDEQTNNIRTDGWTDGQQRPTRGRTDVFLPYFIHTLEEKS